ncbi:MAG: hypothetical protein F2708_05075 [Actinobacteria bacterium]|uniref:Unannotated protein n=1 Tax=freshwater metagenome TaxID=449393 RepID=A0A6J6UQU7_9ZZZZ|nr:hypothetical protein [Actinomycetota bacterium]
MEINSVAIGTFIEPELVEKIRLEFPQLHVVYEPKILPAPRYKCDHYAPSRDLSDAEIKKWLEATSGVDAYFDFDWYNPEEMFARNPSLKWIQATKCSPSQCREHFDGSWTHEKKCFQSKYVPDFTRRTI